MKVNYDLIGSMPSMEQYRNSLPQMIAEYEAMKTTNVEGIDKAKLEKMAAGVMIEMCATHFYGIDISDVGSMRELIDIIKSADQALEAK